MDNRRAARQGKRLVPAKVRGVVELSDYSRSQRRIIGDVHTSCIGGGPYQLLVQRIKVSQESIYFVSERFIRVAERAEDVARVLIVGVRILDLV